MHWSFSWRCPLCSHEHHWTWEPHDFPGYGEESATRMACETAFGGCGKEPRMYFDRATESWIPAGEQ
jgi:hypothetical protein